MPLPEEPSVKPLAEIVVEVGLYPIEAYHFVEQGLNYTVNKVHGPARSEPQESSESATQLEPEAKTRHVSGAALCEGLRELAQVQWGMLARTVLQRWNITSTLDFGRIVFALIAGGRMQKTEADTLEDFRNVFDFKTAFEGDYRIQHKST